MALESQHNRLESESITFYMLLVFFILLFGFNTFSHLREPIGDEAVHAFQIHRFLNGNFEFFHNLTMLPGYHALNALISKLFDYSDFNILRFSNLILSALSLPVLYKIINLYHAEEARVRLLQFLTIPFVFPLFFLIYTDITSLFFVLSTFYLLLKKQHKLAALTAIFALLIRQTNIIWVAYFCALNIFNYRGFDISKAYVVGVIKEYWPYLCVACLFLLYVFLNGGVAAGDKEQHPISFNISNMYFMLFVSFCVFSPVCIANTKNIIQLLKGNTILWVIIIIGFFVYMHTYEHPHKYNTKELSFYRHNLFIYYTSDILWMRILNYFLMGWFCLTYWISIVQGKFKNELMLLVPFTLLSVVPLPLIEHRYYLMFICLFMIFRPSVAKIYDVITLLFFGIFSAYIAFNVSRMTFFL